METALLPATNQAITTAAGFLRQGELVAFPTETVYGLGACIFNEEAMKKIFQVKGRPSDNPLIAHISSLAQVDRIAKELPQQFYILANAFFPGPLTIVVPRNDTVPALVNPNSRTIAIRMPNHEVALSLINCVGEPLVAPSANLSGKPSPTTAQDVLEDLNEKISAVIDGGPCLVGIESTVLDLTTARPTILRPGKITKKQIEQLLQETVSEIHSPNDPVNAPGMKYRHYAPETKIRLSSSWEEIKQILEQQPSKNYLLLANESAPFMVSRTVQQQKLSSENLYSAFRSADRTQIKEILIFLDQNTMADAGMMNRIQKASSPH